MSKVYSVNEAAKQVGMKPKTLLQWIHRGKVKPMPVKVGWAYVFTINQVNNLRKVCDNRKK